MRRAETLVPASVARAEIRRQRGRRGPELEAHARVVPRRVARQRHGTRLAVVDEAACRVAEGEVVGQVVGGGGDVGGGAAAAELEAVAVALEVGEAPAGR